MVAGTTVRVTDADGRLFNVKAGTTVPPNLQEAYIAATGQEPEGSRVQTEPEVTTAQTKPERHKMQEAPDTEKHVVTETETEVEKEKVSLKQVGASAKKPPARRKR